MIATLREGQADLPRLVELASQGEEVVITVDGKPKAKLTRAEADRPDNGAGPRRVNISQWMDELEELRGKYSTGKPGPTVEQILDEDRTDRL